LSFIFQEISAGEFLSRSSLFIYRRIEATKIVTIGRCPQEKQEKMSLDKSLESIREADLQELIADAFTERAVIDYKSQLPGNTDGDKKEFLADVSSFANAVGGHLVYGMEEMAGLPTALAGVQALDANAEKLRLEQIIRSGVAPRIPSIEIGEPIRLSNGRSVFIIRVPRSWISPHMVTYQGHSKFYSRNSAGKYPLDVQEIRTAFLSSESTTDRLRDFRAERISKIVAGITPAKLQAGLRIVVHVIPLSALDTRQRFDPSALRGIHRPGELQPIYSSTVYNSRFNFDGYLISEQFNDNSTIVAAYLQLFRNGIFESVNTLVHLHPADRKFFPSFEFEGKLLQSLPQYFAALKKLGMRPPVFLALSLIGISGYSMDIPQPAALGLAYSQGGRIENESLLLSEVMIESFECDLGEALKPACDAVWNAAGWAGTIFYEKTQWTGLKRFLSRRG